MSQVFVKFCPPCVQNSLVVIRGISGMSQVPVINSDMYICAAAAFLQYRQQPEIYSSFDEPFGAGISF